jgi:hypothetical protein
MLKAGIAGPRFAKIYVDRAEIGSAQLIVIPNPADQNW